MTEPKYENTGIISDGPLGATEWPTAVYERLPSFEATELEMLRQAMRFDPRVQRTPEQALMLARMNGRAGDRNREQYAMAGDEASRQRAAEHYQWAFDAAESSPWTRASILYSRAVLHHYRSLKAGVTAPELEQDLELAWVFLDQVEGRRYKKPRKRLAVQLEELARANGIGAEPEPAGFEDSMAAREARLQQLAEAARDLGATASGQAVEVEDDTAHGWDTPKRDGWSDTAAPELA